MSATCPKIVSALILGICLPYVSLAQAPSEREISLNAPAQKDTLLEAIGFSRPDIGGIRLSAFVVASFSYNSHIQMVPEFAGGAAALADPGASNFRFDKFGLGVSKVFAPWLSAGAAFEVENHRDRHTHGFNPTFGCPGDTPCMERFGAEEAEIEVNLDHFYVTAVAPLGNGLALSFGRFAVPFGIERHDEPLLLTATTSEVFRFGRPERMTGFQASYPFAPWLDLSLWAVNRWENEVTGEGDFNDNNHDKSFGGRIGFTPLAHPRLLNIGLGGFWGPEQDDRHGPKRWVIDVDATWSPLPQFLIAGEFVYGGEEARGMRQRGGPIAAPETVQDVNWWGMYILTYYEFVPWFGCTFRYGFFDDMDGGRTGVAQQLQSWSFVPTFHLSRLIPKLRPTGTMYARTQQPIDWINVKLEYRLNHSNKTVFSDAEPAEDILDAAKTSHQVQVQFVINF